MVLDIHNLLNDTHVELSGTAEELERQLREKYGDILAEIPAGDLIRCVSRLNFMSTINLMFLKG